MPQKSRRDILNDVLSAERRNLPDAEIAKYAGITPDRLAKVRSSSEYIVMRAEAYTLKGGPRYVPPIQRREVRLAALNERWCKLLSIMDERGESEEAQAIPGGSSGLLVKTWKMGSTKDAIREEWVLDKDLLRELREIEKHVATELGQWTEKTQQDTKLDINVKYVDDWRSDE